MNQVFSRMMSTLTSTQTARIFRYLSLLIVCYAVLGVGGCGFGGKPRRRLGCYATSTPGTRYTSSDKLGKHSYGFNLFETNGITYTCKGGHIDVAHLRIAADNTKYMSEKIYDGMMKGQKDFTFSLVADCSKHVMKLSYPDNWSEMDKNAVAKDVSLQLGQYMAFSATTWHEMLTWFGYHTMVFIPEKASAFSWEDIYSNLLGTSVAAEALRNTNLNYDDAMTVALNKELTRLGGRSGKFAKKAAQKVRGDWFKGNLSVSMKKRNVDIGLDDGYVTPMIVPGVCGGARPEPLAVPTDDVSRHGFSVNYHIVPREFEKGKILSIVHKNRKAKTITPDIHYGPIIAHIANVAVAKYGPGAITPYDPDRSIERRLAALTPLQGRPARTLREPKKYARPQKTAARKAVALRKPVAKKVIASRKRAAKKGFASSVPVTSKAGASQNAFAKYYKSPKASAKRVRSRAGIQAKKIEAVKSVTLQSNSEYPALRVTISPNARNYDAFQKLLNSTSGKLEQLENKLSSE